MTRRADHVLRALFGFLVAVGLAGAMLRAVAIDDLLSRIEPVRGRVLAALALGDPAPEARAVIVAEADRKFASHRTATWLHIATGAGFLALAPLQLTRRLRQRSPRVHRVTGRVAIGLAGLAGLSGLYFGVLHPFAGIAEQVIVGAAGLALLTAVITAFVQIRAGRVAGHREWMLRAVAAAVAISSVRVVALPLDLVLSPRGVDVRTVFALSLWIGWLTTFAVAEWWIHATRPKSGGAT